MDPLFEVHMLNEEGKLKAKAIAKAFNACLSDVTAEVGSSPSRELSLAKTHMEEACFYAKKAMANNPANQNP